MVFRRIIIGAFVLAVLLLHANAQDAIPTVRSQTRVVQIDVVAKDSKGRPVVDLTKQEFTVTDGHRTREIQIFSVDLGDKGSGRSAAPAALPPHVFSNRIPAVAEPGRVIAVVLDGNNTTFDDFASARLQLIDLLGKLKTGDRMAIYVLHLGVRIVQDYTSDRDLLLKRINAYRPPALKPRPVMTFRPPRRGTGGLGVFEDVSDELTAEMTPAETAYFVRRRAEETMAAFRSISSHMAILPGRKSVIWISGGFSWRQLNQSKELFDRTADAMNNANVALYAIDARLLMHGTENNIATMRQFAEATGGKAYYHRNDLDGAVQEAIEDSRVTYTLAFYLADEERDGKFHPLRVSVNRRGVQLRYRKGYYASQESSSGGSPAEKSKELEAELLNPLDATGVLIDARIDVLEEGTEKKIQIRMVLDPSTVTLKPAGAGWTGKVEALFVERAQDGAVLGKVTSPMQFQVTEKTRAAYEAGKMILPAWMRLVNGAVKLHIIVRDTESGRTGTLTVPLE